MGSKTEKSRSRSAKGTRSGSFRAGRVTRNPFLNFLRDFRKANNGLKVTELTKRGAELWRKMNDRQKSPYCQLARQAPKRRRRRRRSRIRRRRRRSRSDSDEREYACSSKKKRSRSYSKERINRSRSKEKRSRSRSKDKRSRCSSKDKRSRCSTSERSRHERYRDDRLDDRNDIIDMD